jgi:hypothetical protein
MTKVTHRHALGKSFTHIIHVYTVTTILTIFEFWSKVVQKMSPQVFVNPINNENEV